MILITGGAGYIGSHAVINFLNAGYDIVVFDNLENGHIETIETLQKIGNVKFERGDLRNIEDIERVFNKYNIDAVIHFAAFALVGESVTNPGKYYRNNAFGTLNLLDTMIKHDVKKIVFSATCATYGEPDYTPIDEKHPQNPINPYGTSKLMVEMIMKDYDKDASSIWKSEIFGRSLDVIVQEGIQSKINLMPENIRFKLQQTLTKVVNKGSNNLIAFVI